MNISLGNVNQVVRQDWSGIKQWIIPKDQSITNAHTASKNVCQIVASITNQESPDLVHIWGTESIWSSIKKQGYIKPKAVLDIQGLLFAYTDYYYGGLTLKEILQSIYLKEILMPWRTLFGKKKVFYRRGKTEIDCLGSFDYIAYQSKWVKDQLQYVLKPNSNIYPTKIMLRPAFYNSDRWEYKTPNNDPVIFSSCSAAVTYKGLHVLLKAIALLKKKYPKVQLHIAGNINVGNKLKDGYSIFLTRLIRKLDLESNVVLVGALNENQIIDELTTANVCVVPSFVETYCLAFAEAMMVGIPTVVSFAGAMPELAEHYEEALFYNSLDYVVCANSIDELIQNKVLAEKLSTNSRARRLRENNENDVIETQISIYKNIIAS
jgi:glycosyltransferase involved in cell wall biosynthesis